jgi:hypothetical protein
MDQAPQYKTRTLPAPDSALTGEQRHRVMGAVASDNATINQIRVQLALPGFT